jgi:colicin import membrane protein
MAADRLALLRELEQADEAIAAELEGVDELYRAVEELRERALELQEFSARLPAERASAAQAVAEADRARGEARAAAQQAAEALAEAGRRADPEALAEARRLEVAARDTLHVIERRAAAARDRASAIEDRARAAEVETGALEHQAAELAAVLARRPRVAAEAVAEPGSGPTALAEWGTRARATVLVARSQAVAERDAVVRQAHELAAVVLGEALPPLGAAEVLRRVERVLEA